MRMALAVLTLALVPGAGCAPAATDNQANVGFQPAGNLLREGILNPQGDQPIEIGRHRDEYRPVAVSGSGFWSAIQAAYLGTLVLVGIVLLGRPIIKGLQGRPEP